MERIDPIILRELSSEKNLDIDVHDNSVKITTPTTSITINNRTKEVINGVYRSPKNDCYLINERTLIHSILSNIYVYIYITSEGSQSNTFNWDNSIRCFNLI